MNISANSVRFDDVTMWVELTDGRTVGVPLAWFPVCCTRHRLSAGFAGSVRQDRGCIGRTWTRTSRSKVCSRGVAIRRCDTR